MLNGATARWPWKVLGMNSRLLETRFFNEAPTLAVESWGFLNDVPCPSGTTGGVDWAAGGCPRNGSPLSFAHAAHDSNGLEPERQEAYLPTELNAGSSTSAPGGPGGGQAHLFHARSWFDPSFVLLSRLHRILRRR